MAKVPVVVHYHTESGYPGCFVHQDPVLLWVAVGISSDDIKEKIARKHNTTPLNIRIKDIKFQ